MSREEKNEDATTDRDWEKQTKKKQCNPCEDLLWM